MIIYIRYKPDYLLPVLKLALALVFCLLFYVGAGLGR